MGVKKYATRAIADLYTFEKSLRVWTKDKETDQLMWQCLRLKLVGANQWAWVSFANERQKGQKFHADPRHWLRTQDERLTHAFEDQLILGTQHTWVMFFGMRLIETTSMILVPRDKRMAARPLLKEDILSLGIRRLVKTILDPIEFKNLWFGNGDVDGPAHKIIPLTTYQDSLNSRNPVFGFHRVRVPQWHTVEPITFDELPERST